MSGVARGLGPSPWDDDPAAYEEVVLVDLLDRVLDKGVVVAGDITLSVADVDLVYVGLRLLLSSASTAARFGAPIPGSEALRRRGLASSGAGSSAGGDALGADVRGDALGATASGDAMTGRRVLHDGRGQEVDDALDADLGFPTT